MWIFSGLVLALWGWWLLAFALMLPSSYKVGAKSLPSHSSISHPSHTHSDQVEITPQSRGNSSERSLLKMHLTRNIRLGSDKSGHKVALFPFVNYLQGQSPDPHVSSDTTLLQTSCLVFQKQQHHHQQKEKIMAVPSGIQNTTQRQILTLSPASNFPWILCVWSGLTKGIAIRLTVH